jgi:hypothetical protein
VSSSVSRQRSITALISSPEQASFSQDLLRRLVLFEPFINQFASDGHALLLLLVLSMVQVLTIDTNHYTVSTEVFYEMKKYGVYDDPMIQLHRSRKLDPNHPESVSFEAHQRNLATTLPAPDTREKEEPFNSALHEAINQLTPTRRTALIRRYGLYGNPKETLTEIAKSKGVTPQAIHLAELSARRSLAKKLPSPSKR